MSRPLSTDLRERLVSGVERDVISARAAAARFGVSVSSAIVWTRRYRETGSVALGKIGGYKPNILGGAHQAASLPSSTPNRASARSSKL